MKPTGLWKIKEVRRISEQFQQVWLDAEALLADPETTDYDLRLLRSFFDFRDDGTLAAVMPIPEEISPEELKEAAAAGEVELYGSGLMCAEKHQWKYEDGRILLGTGKDYAPWTEIPEENGVITFLDFRLVKA